MNVKIESILQFTASYTSYNLNHGHNGVVITEHPLLSVLGLTKK